MIEPVRGEPIAHDVVRFHEVDQTQVALVGGKGAHLGELSRIEGVRVPDGFCVTTHAFERIMTDAGD
jgi:pyruvate,water dikinase